MYSISAQKKNIKIIYFSSGGSVYGKQNKLPIQECFDTNPISLYGLSKLTLEKFLIYLSQNEKLNYLIIRPSNVYGYDNFYPPSNSKIGKKSRNNTVILYNNK